jgi:ATP-dependent DNA helicase RecG
MPQAASLDLTTPLSEVGSIPASTQKMLAKEGLGTVADVLLHLPFRHEDRRRMDFAGFSVALAPVCHHVRIVSTRVLRFGRRGGVFEAVVEGAAENPLHQQLTLRWFSMPYMQRVFAVDMELVVYGKIKEAKTRLVMDHPEYEIIRGEDGESDIPNLHTGRIVPVYRLRGGLKQKPLRAAVWRVLEALDDARKRSMMQAWMTSFPLRKMQGSSPAWVAPRHCAMPIFRPNRRISIAPAAIWGWRNST